MNPRASTRLRGIQETVIVVLLVRSTVTSRGAVDGAAGDQSLLDLYAIMIHPYAE